MNEKAARASSWSLLADPDAHLLGVALHAAAWLHDVGYASEIVLTGFHPLDGARWLVAKGVDQRIVRLVAHHSCADIEAEARGLSSDLSAFPVEESRLVEALIFCDMTASPDGELIGAEERITRTADRGRCAPGRYRARWPQLGRPEAAGRMISCTEPISFARWIE